MRFIEKIDVQVDFFLWYTHTRPYSWTSTSTKKTACLHNTVFYSVLLALHSVPLLSKSRLLCGMAPSYLSVVNSPGDASCFCFRWGGLGAYI